MIGHYSTANLVGFFVIVAVFLWIDLHAHKKDEPITLRNATLWSCVWIALALAFGVFIWLTHGLDDASLYLSGYFLEKSLSVDNLFVMMAVFSSFAIKGNYQHRVLYYGILGALILRMIFVAAGNTLVQLLTHTPWPRSGFSSSGRLGKCGSRCANPMRKSRIIPIIFPPGSRDVSFRYPTPCTGTTFS